MQPSLVVPDPPHAAQQGQPELPALSELIRMGDAAPDQDWRSGVLQDFGGARLAAATPAEIASLAVPLDPGTAICVATPVHVVAGMNRVHLHAAGIVQLPAAQRSLLEADFLAQFGAEMRLHRAAAAWLLEAPWAAVADDGDPSASLGTPLSRTPAATAPQKAMRRAGAEIEMWLAALDCNQVRARQGDLAVNLLWCWGGGRALSPSSFAALPPLRLYASQIDPWCEGLGTLGTMAPLPDAWNDQLSAQSPLVILSADAPGAHSWLEWEQRWFAPVLRDLLARRIETLSLRLGPRSWQVRPRLWRRLLRRSRPWWQAARA